MPRRVLHIVRSIREPRARLLRAALADPAATPTVLLIQDALEAEPAWAAPTWVSAEDARALGYAGPLPRMEDAEILDLLFECDGVITW